jgi:hypothetical protein
MPTLPHQHQRHIIIIISIIPAVPVSIQKKYERSEFNKFAKQKKPHLTA